MIESCCRVCCIAEQPGAMPMVLMWRTGLPPALTDEGAWSKWSGTVEVQSGAAWRLLCCGVSWECMIGFSGRLAAVLARLCSDAKGWDGCTSWGYSLRAIISRPKAGLSEAPTG